MYYFIIIFFLNFNFISKFYFYIEINKVESSMANSRNSKLSKNSNPFVIIIIIIIVLLLGVIGYLIYRILKKKEENHIYIDEEDNENENEEESIPQNLSEPFVHRSEVDE